MGSFFLTVCYKMEYLGEIEDYMDAIEVAPEDAQPANKKVEPKKGPKQTKLNVKPEYYGLKINECELSKHNVTVLEIIKKFDFTTWVVGRDEVLGKKSIPHYHIHFKSTKTIDALRKQKQVVMPNWGRSTKLGPPSSDMDNWYCWAGYATKEKIIGMSSDISDLDKVEIAKHAHTQATIKKSKLDWSNKQDEKEEAKKDLKTRMYNHMDKQLVPGYSTLGPVAVMVSEFYLGDVQKVASMMVIKGYVWEYVLLRKIVTHEFYVRCGNSTDFFSMYIS